MAQIDRERPSVVDWNDLKIALAVARHGSLSAAARALGTTQPTISRRLAGFERKTGVKLFERGKEGLTPTRLGAALTDGLDLMDEGALAVERRIASRDTGLQGPITVTSLDWLGDYILVPIAARFGRLHPLVEIELLNDTRVFNISRRDADIAFRFGTFEQENLVLRKVADAAYGFYASPDYLERQGPPNFDQGCSGHAIVLLHDEAGLVCYRDWAKKLAPQATVLLRSNSAQSHFAAVEAGEAMAALPRVLADRRPTLRRIATPLAEPVQAIRMGFHADMRDSPRLRAFIDFAVEEFEAQAGALNPAP